MADEKTRDELFQTLDAYFYRGHRPTAAEWRDLGRSFFNFQDDRIDSLEADDTTQALWSDIYTGEVSKLADLPPPRAGHTNNHLDQLLNRLLTAPALLSGATFEANQALRDGLPYTGPLAVTLGSQSAGDGGAGFWRYVDNGEAGTYCDDDVAVIVPAGNDGSHAWLRLVYGAVSVLAAGMTTNVADATSNWERLVALCRYLSGMGGGIIDVPNVGDSFKVNGGVPPQYMDRMHIRGNGTIEHCDPGGPNTLYAGPIFYLGTYGPNANAAVIWNETGYTIQPASQGDRSITFVNVADANNFADGDLCIVHDGNYYERDPVNPAAPMLVRYFYPQVREVSSVVGGAIVLDKPLTASVGNTPICRRLNTGNVPVQDPGPSLGLDTAYMARDVRIECNLSVAANEYEKSAGLFTPCGGYRCTIRGRHKSPDGLTANLFCQADIDVWMLSQQRCWDGGYGSEGNRVRVLWEHDPHTGNNDGAFIYINEGCHHNKLQIRSNGPQPVNADTQIVLATFGQAFDLDLDLDFPQWAPPSVSRAIYYAVFEEDVGGNKITATDVTLRGRVRVKSVERVARQVGAANGSAYPIKLRAEDLTIIIDDGVTVPEEGWQFPDCSEIELIRVQQETHADVYCPRVGKLLALDCYMPNSDIVALQPLEGYDQWINGNTFANRLANAQLRRTGQFNSAKDERLRVEGGLIVGGPIYSLKANTPIAAGATETLKAATELEDGAIYLLTVSTSAGDLGGVAVVQTTVAELTVVTISATGCAFGDDGGAGITVTNNAVGSRTVSWSLLNV